MKDKMKQKKGIYEINDSQLLIWKMFKLFMSDAESESVYNINKTLQKLTAQIMAEGRYQTVIV